MKTQTVKIKKFKKLEDFEAQMDGRNILLIGDNGVGKSSLIQFIEIALGKQSDIPANITGAGEVIFNKDGQEIKVSVEFKDGKPYLKVRGQGISIDNKKSAIAELFGAIEFSIDEFVALSKTTAGQKKQVEIFKSFLPMDIRQELAKHESNIQNDYGDRSELNKDIKRLEGSIALHPLINHQHELEKFSMVSVESVMSEMKAIQETNSKIAGFTEKMSHKKMEQLSIEKRIGETEVLLKELKKTHKENAAKIKEGEDYLEKNPIKDISDLEAKIKEASETNSRADKAKQLAADLRKLQELKEQTGELTAKIEASRQAISDTIKQLDSPVDGLTYEDDTLVYNGIPVNSSNLSKSEIIELGIRLKMAENPELGMLFIQEGESIGQERLDLIQEIADKAGWQIIMEQVDRGKKELHVEIMEG